MPVRGIPLFCTLLLGLPFAGLTLAGCQIPNPGIPPVQATLNFPIALALTAPASNPDAQSDFLLVVNANYDARYNQGTILSLDMRQIMLRFDEIRANGRFPQNGHMGCTNPASWDDPNVECQIAEAVDVMAGSGPNHDGAEVWIDSFGAGIVRSPQGDRFYIPTRSTSNLTWVDIDPSGTGAIMCDQAPGSLRCGDRRRTTMVETGCTDRDVTLRGDPNALVVMPMSSLVTLPAGTAERDVLLMLQRNGTAALYLDSLEGGLARQPIRTHVLTGLPPDAINAELETSTGLAWVSTSSPVSTRATRLLARVGVFIDTQNEHCSQAFAAPPVFLDGLATGFDTRDVAFSADTRYAYVLSRSPESIITIDQEGTPFIPGNAAITDVDDVGFGPSRLRRITMDGRDFLVTTCFDGRAVWVMSTAPTQVASIVPGFDGAYEMVIDVERRLAIVADFKTSVIRFVDLAPAVHGHDAVVLGRVGTPRTHVGFP